VGGVGQIQLLPERLKGGSEMNNHMPFDNGAIADSFGAVISKTTKTRCGKRVPVVQADHTTATTCADCLADIKAEKAFIQQARESLKAATA
jgi:hypothetical protein